MSCECKFKGICKDCKKNYPAGTTIDKNTNDNWCPDGKNCTGCKSAPQSSEPEKATSSEEFLKSKQDEIKVDEQKQDQMINTLTKKHFTETQLLKLNARMEKQMVLEHIADLKLSSATSFPPNPAKIGMHTKFLADYMEKMIEAESI